MKLKKTSILTICVIMLLCIFILFYKFVYESKSENTNSDVEIIDTLLLSNTCTYTENNEDMSKNYILNGNELSKVKYPYKALLKMGDELDLYLKSNGYVQQQLTIISVVDNEPIYKCKCEIGTTGETIDINYDLITNEFSFIIYK